VKVNAKQACEQRINKKRGKKGRDTLAYSGLLSSCTAGDVLFDVDVLPRDDDGGGTKEVPRFGRPFDGPAREVIFIGDDSYATITGKVGRCRERGESRELKRSGWHNSSAN